MPRNRKLLKYEQQMRVTTAIVAMSLTIANTSAFASEVLILGIGRSSCANWISTAESEVTVYIYGYWSAVNEMMREFGHDGTVGSQTDPPGKVGEVRLECQQHPSLRITEAIMRAYTKMRTKEGK